MSATEVANQADSRTIQYTAPAVEISETEKAIWLIADMPGVGSNGATVELKNDVLSLEGAVEKTERREPRHYRRRFTLNDPSLFDLDKVTAKMSNGVLEVEIPKMEKPRPRQIKITAS